MPNIANSDYPFCVSAYDDEETYEAGGESRDSNFKTKAEAQDAFEKLTNGGKFYAVAYGYRGATGDFIDFDEWTRDDD